MTHRATAGRTLGVEALARVEGEGGLVVETVDGRVVGVELRIYEPPRFFEAFLRGRGHQEPPDLTARICGICPVAYQMSACRAIEDACGATVDGPLDDLRRLIYCGEWIESHALHVYLLHAPDFLGAQSAVELAERDRPAVERGLRLKQAGNHLVEVIGGRAIHPVNIRVGGFHRVPTRRELRRLREPLEQARDDAAATVAWVAGFDFPDRRIDDPLVAVSDPGHYPVIGGRVVSTAGLDIAEHQFLDHVVEEHVARSTALHATLDGDRYAVGPLARYALASDRLSPGAREAARGAGLGDVERNPFRSVVVRAVEVLHACEEGLRLVDGYEEPDRPAVAVEPREAVGHGCTEAPRGLLYHRYALDGDGTVLDARIVPPTSQNQGAIEHDVWHVVEDNLHLDDEALTRLAEQAIRNHDPCISCAAHFLDLRRFER
ncbi:MAG TPA: nickel-dependent hydrogenase large subunit [Acidimicrobiales bacterium]